MKPTCKLCETKHWTYEDHGMGLSAVQALGAAVLKRVVVFPDPPESVTTTTGGPLVNKRTEPLNGRNKRTRGRPKKWASEAERKRAYRGRSK